MSTQQPSPATQPSAADQKKRTNAALKAWATRRKQNPEKWGKPAAKKGSSKPAVSKSTAKAEPTSNSKRSKSGAGKAAAR
jgi:hypothetical protein